MSSPTKDARWQLAATMAEDAGLDSINDLPYPAAEAVLQAAQGILNHIPTEKVLELANRHNDPDAELAALRQKISNAIGYEPVPVSIDGYPGIRLTHRTVDDRDQLVDRISKALS